MVFSAFTLHWLMRGWDSLSFEELLFHMRASLDGTNPEDRFTISAIHWSEEALISCLKVILRI